MTPRAAYRLQRSFEGGDVAFPLTKIFAALPAAVLVSPRRRDTNRRFAVFAAVSRFGRVNGVSSISIRMVKR